MKYIIVAKSMKHSWNSANSYHVSLYTWLMELENFLLVIMECCKMFWYFWGGKMRKITVEAWSKENHVFVFELLKMSVLPIYFSYSRVFASSFRRNSISMSISYLVWQNTKLHMHFQDDSAVCGSYAHLFLGPNWSYN